MIPFIIYVYYIILDYLIYIYMWYKYYHSISYLYIYTHHFLLVIRRSSFLWKKSKHLNGRPFGDAYGDIIREVSKHFSSPSPTKNM